MNDERGTSNDAVDYAALAEQISAAWIEAWLPVLQAFLHGMATLARDLQEQGYLDSEFNLTSKAFVK